VLRADYNRLVALSANPSDALASQISQERLDTCTWLHTDSRPPASQLAAARKRTDAAVAGYRGLQHATQGLRPAAASPAQDSLISLLDHLPRLRAAADARVLSPAAAFQAYNKIMDARRWASICPPRRGSPAPNPPPGERA
jgi:nitrate/nitrite sensing protein